MTPQAPGAPALTPEVAHLRALCLALPDATSDFPFGPETEMFRVRGKMFALVIHHARISPHWMVNLKVDPDMLPGLVAAHDDVLPGYHMSKKHWVSVELHPRIDRAFLADLVEDSYDLVVSGLPMRHRPVTHQHPTGETRPGGHA